MTDTTTATPEMKLKELILYVAQRCERHHFFGTIKLNKILLYSDWNSYLRRGQGVTGIAYVKDIFGPVPRGMSLLVERMEADRDVVVLHRPMADLTIQDRVVARREPVLSMFDPEDIAIVNEVIDWIRPMAARKVSDLTHKSVGWNTTHFGEEIPYSAALIPDSPIPLTPEEIDCGVALGQKIAERALSAG
jgi:hypothetical protein